MSDDPDVIYLSPRCHDTGEGREWCVDDVWGPCEECGAPSVKYVRADALDARDAEIARWHQWAARYFERCEEAQPDEYEYIRSEVMEMCRPYAERSGST